MQFVSFVFILVSAAGAHAGYFVEKALFVDTYVAVGRGRTLKEARDDAYSAIPKATKYRFYDVNSVNRSPGFQCLETGVWTEKDECGELGEIQYVLPLRRIEI